MHEVIDGRLILNDSSREKNAYGIAKTTLYIERTHFHSARKRETNKQNKKPTKQTETKLVKPQQFVYRKQIHVYITIMTK